MTEPKQDLYLRNVLRIGPRSVGDEPTDLKNWPQPAARRFTSEPWLYDLVEEVY